MSYLCTVKRALVLYIIFIQLLSCFSAAATPQPALNSEPQKEASLLPASFLRDQPAELTPSPTITCISLRVRDQRFAVNLLNLTAVRTCIPGKLNYAAATPYVPIYRPLIRLLL